MPLEAGYDVYVVVDASGTTTPTVRDAAWLRMAQAGAQLGNLLRLPCWTMALSRGNSHASG